MKAKVKRPYFDAKGLHKIGEVVDVEKLSPLVEAIDEPVKETKPKTTRKTTKK